MEQQLNHIAIEVENRSELLKTFANLYLKGVEIEGLPFVHGIENGDEFFSGDSGHHAFYVKGPAGTRWEIYTESSTTIIDGDPPSWEEPIQKFIQERETAQAVAD